VRICGLESLTYNKTFHISTRLCSPVHDCFVSLHRRWEVGRRSPGFRKRKSAGTSSREKQERTALLVLGFNSATTSVMLLESVEWRRFRFNASARGFRENDGVFIDREVAVAQEGMVVPVSACTVALFSERRDRSMKMRPPGRVTRGGDAGDFTEQGDDEKLFRQDRGSLVAFQSRNVRCMPYRSRFTIVKRDAKEPPEGLSDIRRLNRKRIDPHD
jgi:hypothetical protein